MAIRRGTAGNDILTGTTAADVITGLAGNDRLTGGNGNDRLDGGEGVDVLIGGNGNDVLIGGLGIDSLRGDAGDDRYTIDNAAEIAKATVDAGTDTVISSVAYALGAHQENLTLSGTANIAGTGNAGTNLLTGNAGNNVLNGGGGADTVRGGNGNDTLVFDAADLLLDGQAGTDTLRLPAAGVNLTALNLATVQNVEVLDLRGSGANGAVLTPTLVAALSATSDTLQVRAGADDTVFISGGWTAAGQVTLGGVLHDRYTAGAVTLNVESVANDDAARVVNGVMSLATLNGANGFRLDGDVAGIKSGASASTAGDVNGDGLDDLLVNAPSAGFGGIFSGSTYVVYGSTLALPAASNVSLASGVRIDGAGATDGAGVGSSAGDINGDGIDDLLVGRPGAMPATDPSGASHAVFGSESGLGTILSLSSVDGTVGFRLDVGDEVDLLFGSATSAGDLNADGIDDIIVGAPYATASGDLTAGISFVLFGRSTGFASTTDLSALDGTTGFTLEGPDPASFAGLSVADAGDVNGDGISDIIVSAPGAANPDRAVYVVFGTTAGFAANIDLGTLNGTNGFGFTNPGIGRLGESVSAAGDVNGDGIGDLIITQSFLGASDGAGAYVVFGRSSAFDSTFDLSQLDGSDGFLLTDVPPDPMQSPAVAAAGDVNGDGFDDLVVGAKYADNGTANSGSTYVVFGRQDGFGAILSVDALNGSNGLRIDGAAAGDQSGRSVAGAGDLNGDGYADIVIGAPYADPAAGADAGSTYVIYGRDFTGSVARPGTSGNDTLTGTTAAESLVGGQGSDTLDGGLGADVLIGGAGDDALHWDASDRRVDGGGGTDTLLVTRGGADLTGTHAVRGIEAIDLRGGSAGTLVLDRAAVFALTDGRNDLTASANTLVVRGDADDLVRLDSTWVAAGTQVLDTVTFDRYTSGNATVLVQEATGVLTGNTVNLGALDGTNGVAFRGDAVDDAAGRAVSCIGDFNGDGMDDFAIGAFSANGTAGAVYVVFGRGDGFPVDTDLATLSGNAGFRIDGAAVSDFTGLTVDAAGDVNGDGLDDLLVVAIGAPAASGRGITYVVFGTATPPATTLATSAIDGTNGFALVGEAALDYSGIAVAGGDVNGDGYDDIVIGAHQPDSDGPGPGVAGTGYVYVVYGKGTAFAASTALDALPAGAAYKVIGAAVNDAAGVAVATADVDGDGYDDIIVGAYQPDPTGVPIAGPGAGYVIYGGPGGGSPPASLATLNGTDGATLTGVVTGDGTGVSVAGAGDVNGDGIEDLIVGAFGADPNGASSGSTYVVFGRSSGFASSFALGDLDGTDGYRIDGALPGDNTGFAVSAAGDVNGDGFDDILVGALGADPGGNSFAGSTWLVFGHGGSHTATLSLATLDVGSGLRFDGIAANDYSGGAVSSAGDVDGDGFDDIIIGASQPDPDGEGAQLGGTGITYLVFGRDYTGAVDQQGTTGNDTLTGGAADEALVGGRGNDTLAGGAGVDVLIGGAGDDVLVWDALDRRVDGGTGKDTLRLDGSGLALDLSQVPDARLTGIDVIDLTGSGGNALVLDLTDVLALSDHATLRIAGNAGDVVLSLGAGWTLDGGGPVVIDGQNYTSWSAGAATLLVDTDITRFLG